MNLLVSLQIISVSLTAIISGLVGVFVLTRRMSLAGDALSHIALPGIGLALMLKLDPLLGGGMALVLGALLVWSIEKRTNIPTETIIGVIFSTSLALGSLLINSGEELLDALFGDISKLTLSESVAGIIISIILAFIIFKLKDRFTLSFISEDIAKTSGLNVSAINLGFLIIFVLSIILGLKFLGVLLMGSLIIIPAASSRNIAKSFNSDLLISSLLSLLSVFVGLFISKEYGLTLGAVIVSVSAFIFFLTVIFKKNN